MTRFGVAFLAVLVTLGLAAGCSDDDGAGDGATASRPPATGLPPATLDGLEPLFRDDLAALGLRLTRGALIDLSDGGYERSRTGTHLALYVEPTGPYTNADFIDGVHRVTDVFAPEIFERWAALESFDVCQEPRPAEDDAEEPPPVTQVNLTRAQAAAIDWDDADTATIVAASLRQPAGSKILQRLDTDLARDPAWRAVHDRAQELGAG